MKKPHLFIVGLILIVAGEAYSQAGTFLAGAYSAYQQPVGTLGSRFRGSAGGGFFFGKQVDDDWSWLGKIEYVELKNVNSSSIEKKVTAQVGGTTRQYTFPLPKLNMELTIAGIIAEGKVNWLRESYATSDLSFGFGFYNWRNIRGSYHDSLFADTSGTGQKMKVAVLAVPENRQSDWSGGIHIGTTVDIRIVDPVWLTFGAQYKVIIGELWQSLALDLENVSGLQFISLSGGLYFYF